MVSGILSTTGAETLGTLWTSVVEFEQAFAAMTSKINVNRAVDRFGILKFRLVQYVSTSPWILFNIGKHVPNKILID